MSDYPRLLAALHAIHAGTATDHIAAQALGFIAGGVPAGGDHQGIADAVRDRLGIVLTGADIEALWTERQRLERG